MNLIKSTSTFSFFTILSRILGYFRDFLIALNLGSGPISDAFFVAFRIPNTFRRLFSEGTFNAAFVPSYSSELKKSKKTANLFSNQVLSFLIIFLLAVVLIIEIIMPIFIYILAPGFIENKEKLDLTILLTRITFPFLIFVSVASFFSAILNSHNKFGVAAAAPIILNVVLILVMYLTKSEKDLIVIYLSYGVSIAGFLQLIVLSIYVKKYFEFRIKTNLKITKKVKNFFKKLLPSIFSSGVTQINILIGTIIASFQANAVSYLYYADRIYQINLAIAGIAIGTIILPNLSKYIVSNDKNKISFIQNKSIELSLFLSMPAIIKIFSTFLFARHNTKTPFHFSLISVVVNIFISVYFFKDYGFIIIPIATTISSWINAILLFIYLQKNDVYKLNFNLFFSFLKIMCLSFISAYFFYYLLNNFSYYLEYGNNFKFLAITLIVSITFLFYIITSIVTKAFNISDIKLKY